MSKVTIQGNASGTGTLTIAAPNTNTDRTLTLPNETGTLLSTGSAVPVANGGTGSTTLTANNVILGNGTSAVNFVAPGASGNLLTSNGTTWTSAAAPSGMVYPGSGIAVSTGSAWGTSKTAPSGAIVGDTDTQTLTNKTLTTPIIATIKSAASGTPTVFQDSAGTQIGTLCRAWCNFNGTSASPITPRSSFNVSSVTKESTGAFTVNFTNSFADANYAVVTGCNIPNYSYGYQVGTNTLSTSKVTLTAAYEGSAALAYDNVEIQVAIFR